MHVPNHLNLFIQTLSIKDVIILAGVIYNTPPCEGDLECRADICIEGPDYEAYDRNNPDHY